MTGLGRVQKAVLIRNGGAIAALVAVNAIARLIVRLSGPDEDTEFYIGLWSLGAMALLAAVAAFLWTRRQPMAQVVADTLVVVTIASLLVALLTPFVSGNSPFTHQGFGEAVRATLVQFLICLAVLGIGAFIGALVAMALGLDPKSRAWKAQAESIRATARRRQRKAQAGARK